MFPEIRLRRLAVSPPIVLKRASMIWIARILAEFVAIVARLECFSLASLLLPLPVPPHAGRDWIHPEQR